mmetsp:Transcript_14886/g.33919  ORF Transcript_14886/g.33919 Transcript_14886/m.33919 type:complete len:210 (+) Transcript_14886:138-767(+)
MSAIADSRRGAEEVSSGLANKRPKELVLPDKAMVRTISGEVRHRLMSGDAEGLEATPAPTPNAALCTPANVARTTWRSTVCPHPPAKRVVHRTLSGNVITPSSTPCSLPTPANLWPSPCGTPVSYPSTNSLMFARSRLSSKDRADEFDGVQQPSWAGLEGFELEAPAMSLVMEESALSGATASTWTPDQSIDDLDTSSLVVEQEVSDRR